MEKAKLRIYGCGGCGINLAKQLTVPNAVGYPAVEKTFLDTSHSNVTEEDNANTFVVAGMSGAGKNRAVAHQAAYDQVVEMLKTFKPGTTNLVLFSTSGGSGSVIGPLVAAELARRQVPAICLVVGSTISAKETDNTLKTLATLQNLASKTAKNPILISYYENITNGEEGSRNINTRTKVDARVLDDATRMALLMGEQHLELDRADIANFICYNKVTSVPPQLVDVVITSDVSRLDTLKGKMISTASVIPNADSEQISGSQLYSTVGYYPKEILDSMPDEKLSLHFATTAVQREPRIAKLKEKVADFTRAASALVEEASKTTEVAGEEEDGFVF